MADVRGLAGQIADIELDIMREELMKYGEELEAKGCEEVEILGAICEAYEERLAFLYQRLYEEDE